MQEQQHQERTHNNYNQFLAFGGLNPWTFVKVLIGKYFLFKMDCIAVFNYFEAILNSIKIVV